MNIGETRENPFQFFTPHPNGTFDIPATLMDSIRIGLPTIQRKRKNFGRLNGVGDIVLVDLGFNDGSKGRLDGGGIVGEEGGQKK